MTLQCAIKMLVTAVSVSLLTIIMSGCHTVEGAGRDVEALGGATADTADDVRGYDRDGTRR